MDSVQKQTAVHEKVNVKQLQVRRRQLRSKISHELRAISFKPAAFLYAPVLSDQLQMFGADGVLIWSRFIQWDLF